MTKKVVNSSNLALRFYRGDGWRLEDLLPYLNEGGEICDSHADHRQDRLEWSYFTLQVGSRFDMKRLYEEQVSEVVRTFNDKPSQTDLEFMEEFNW